MGTKFASGFGQGKTGDVAGQAAASQALAELKADAADFAVVFSSPSYDYQVVLDGVRTVAGDIELIGATAMCEFTDRGIHTSALADTVGVTVALVASDEMRFFTALGRDAAADREACIADAAAELPSSVQGYPHLTGLFLSSAVAGINEEIAMLAYQELPIQWMGGGASDAQFEDLSIFVGGETASDAIGLAVIASKRPFGLGVGLGHEPIGASFEVTKSEGNIVYELDGEPAYEMWKRGVSEPVQQRYGYHIDEIERRQELLLLAFSELVFGIRTGDDEYKVRTPLLTLLFSGEHQSDDGPPEADESQVDLTVKLEPPTLGHLEAGALYFTQPIPEGVVLHVLASSESGTVGRGEASVQHALAELDEEGVAGGIVFDCPCGEFVLGDGYHRLIDGVTEAIDAPIVGFQSGGGELCFRQDDMRGFHDTATTVLLFPKGGRV